MDSNVVDINHNLKTLLATSSNDETDKAVKRDEKGLKALVRLDCSLAFSGDSLTTTVLLLPFPGTASSISLPNMRNFSPSNTYNYFYVRSTNNDFLSKNYRVLCLDNTYNEFWQYGTTNAVDSTIPYQLPIQCRGINKIELLENSYLNTAGTAYRFLLSHYQHVDGANTYDIRYGATTNNREYTNFYTVPKGKKVRLISIDSYYNTNSGNIEQVVFKKQSSVVVVNPLIYADTYFNDPNVKNSDWFYEGDVIIYNSRSSGSTNMLFNSTYEIKNI